MLKLRSEFKYRFTFNNHGQLLLYNLLRGKLKIDYELTSKQHKNAKKTKFLIIGSGFSGLCCGHFFKLMGLDFVIIEKGPSIGGTWYWNTYSGVEVDIPSFLYSFRHGSPEQFNASLHPQGGANALALARERSRTLKCYFVLRFLRILRFVGENLAKFLQE